uniref:dolichyl-phosphate-mannose--protein mannosyltransferase n=1 Tax=Saccoglossus kowalevskii TaxID=10224 RepID=A0ABM0MDA8_SACKO|nr:PREDICTED: transmembrane and TPR repeat-containing protein 1-like [Saccoglossus kowalevskii]
MKKRQKSSPDHHPQLDDNLNRTKASPVYSAISEDILPIKKGFILPELSLLLYTTVITIMCIVCYYNSLEGDFVHDDIMAIRDNEDIRPGSPIRDVFLNDFWGKRMSDNTSHKSYRPLCVLTFRMNYYLSGLDPYSYHIVNVVLHTLVSVLFLHLCHTIVFLDIKPAFVAALLFATHPVHTEAVTGIVGRADVLACLLFILSFLTFLRILNSKSIDSTCLPLVKRIIVILIMVLILMVFRIWMLNGQLPAFSDQDNPASFAPHLSTRFLTYSYLIVFNGLLLLSPITLCYDWQMGSIPLVESITDPRNLATFCFFIVMAILAIHCLQCFVKEKLNHLRIILIGLSFLVIPFIPASNLFIRVGFVVAERILYIPSLGFCVLVAHGLNSVCKSSNKNMSSAVTALVIAVALFFTWRTIIRNPVWHSREALFKSGVHTLPHNAKAHYNYANLLKDTDRHVEAIQHYRKTLELYPSHASAHNNLGTMLKDDKECEFHFTQAIAINPMHVRAHFNLANQLGKIPDRQDEAIRLLLRAIEIKDDYAEAYTSLAGILMDRGQYDDAEKLYKKVIELTPNDGNVYNNYGALLVKRDLREEALAEYHRCLSVNPNHTVAMVNIARLQRKMGNTRDAELMFKRALAVKREADTLKSLGALYFNTDRISEAKVYFEEALGLDPESAEIRTHYAQLLARLKRFDDALNILNDVIKRQPEYSGAYRHIAGVYGLITKHTEAIKHIDKYLELEPDLDPVVKAEIIYEKGNNYRDIGDNQLALKCYEDCVKVNPKFSTGQMNLGAMLHLQGDLSRASYHYNAALKLDPSNAVLQENIKKLQRRLAQIKNN